MSRFYGSLCTHLIFLQQTEKISLGIPRTWTSVLNLKT